MGVEHTTIVFSSVTLQVRRTGQRLVVARATEGLQHLFAAVLGAGSLLVVVGIAVALWRHAAQVSTAGYIASGLVAALALLGGASAIRTMLRQRGTTDLVIVDLVSGWLTSAYGGAPVVAATVAPLLVETETALMYNMQRVRTWELQLRLPDASISLLSRTAIAGAAPPELLVRCARQLAAHGFAAPHVCALQTAPYLLG